MKRALKITAVVLAVIVGALILTVGGYALYVVLQYSRIEDHLPLEIGGKKGDAIEAGEELSALTYNIGFGAYAQDFSFFMDSGTMLDGTKVSGKYAKARSKEIVEENTRGVLSAAKEQNTDFYLFQEVDTDADRSHHINQFRYFYEDLGDGYAYTFAENFHSANLLYPFNDPIGKSNSGLATFFAYSVISAERRQYPVDKGFAKFFDLDRCFAVHYLSVDNGRQLVLINSHMSAYDEGGKIRHQQLALLNSVLQEEYAKGNYVVVGGDFNHDIADSLHAFATRQEVPEWVYVLKNEDLAEHFSFAAAKNAPTCRSTDMPYEKGVNYSVVLDGFVVSDNVTVVSVENVDTDFKYSDHNPAVMKFILD